MLITAPGLGDSISGAIFYDETIRQSSHDGRRFVDCLIDAGIIPGIEVDTGARPLALHAGEKVTEGLDGLRDRLGEYVEMGARFAKWHGVIGLDGNYPSSACIRANTAAIARYAATSVALCEIGRIERSIFICDWFLDPKLRRRSHAILNKGESRHALARAIVLHQLGKRRNRVAETMAYRASGLNLVVNAIILWNTVYLSRAVRFVHDQGTTIPDALLAQVAPLPWSHIALTDDFLWNEIDRPLERYHPIRANHFKPKSFVFLSVHG